MHESRSHTDWCTRRDSPVNTSTISIDEIAVFRNALQPDGRPRVEPETLLNDCIEPRQGLNLRACRQIICVRESSLELSFELPQNFGIGE